MFSGPSHFSWQPRGLTVLVPCCSWFSFEQISVWGTCTLRKVGAGSWSLGSYSAHSLHKPWLTLSAASGLCASSCYLPTRSPWGQSPGCRPGNCCWDVFLNLPRGCYREFNWSISCFPFGALGKLILRLPNSFLPSHQALSVPGLGLLTTICIIHARQVTVERVASASQAWLSNTAPDFGGEVGFYWCLGPMSSCPEAFPFPWWGRFGSAIREKPPSPCPVG